MDYSLKLRIASVFILFAASLLGVVAPLYYSSRPKNEQTPENLVLLTESPTFRIIRSFAAGIMLGVGFIHLLADGVGKLLAVSLDYPPLGYTLATVGAIVVLGFEQIAVTMISRIGTGSETDADSVLKNMNDIESNSSEIPQVLDVVESHSSTKPCDHSHAFNMITGTSSLSVIVKAYMMEISVAIHSVIIGVALGSMAGEENIQSLQALLIAICFHQFFEGLGLGTVIAAARLHFGTAKIALFALIFALTVPVGVIIGIFIINDQTLEEGPTVSQQYTEGCLNSLAAGIMIYVALVEMIAEDFQSSAIRNNITLKIKMYCALVVGNLFLAVLAIWA
jgi:solute carrier family 39 (zinc transporter), member 1/2/3